MTEPQFKKIPMDLLKDLIQVNRTLVETNTDDHIRIYAKGKLDAYTLIYNFGNDT